MRAAAIFERARTALAGLSPFEISIGVLAGLLLSALWWLWPTTAVVTGLILLVGCGVQIAALRRKVRELADRDPLTGVASRACFSDALQRAVRQCTRFGTPLSVAVLDCDDFKQVNERYGHAVGDAVLVEVAAVLGRMAEGTGTVGRMWGDAFGILLPGFTLEAARDLLRELDGCLKARMSEHDWPVTFSIGVSCQGGPNATPEELLADADALMFAVKRRGRNGIACRGLDDESSTLIQQPSPELARQP